MSRLSAAIQLTNTQFTYFQLDRLIRGLDSAWPKFSYATTDANQDNLVERLIKEGEELAAKQEMISRKLNEIERQEKVSLFHSR